MKIILLSGPKKWEAYSGLWLLYAFLRALGPAEIKITRDYVTTNKDFINGLDIEKIQVDSLGTEGYPVKYTTVYTTSCNIQHPNGRPPEPPDKIFFYKPGKYFWDEDTIRVRYIHKGFVTTIVGHNKQALVAQ